MSFFGDPSVGMMGGGGIWSILNAYYSGKSKDVSATTGTTVSGLAFSADGTKMYVCAYTVNTIYQFTLSTPWDVSTAYYASKSKDVSAQVDPVHEFEFSSDGTKMYVQNGSTSTIYQYALSTAWDVSTASYASKNFQVYPTGASGSFCFKSDGTSVFYKGGFSTRTRALGTAWDISTCGAEGDTVETTGAGGMFFRPDGTSFYTVGSDSDAIRQYNLTSPWDISTSSFLWEKDISAQEGNSVGLFFSSDGKSSYVIGQSQKTVYQYTLA